ncbi:MAG: cyclic pyranopterin monophosphate synthase MoaC [Planctomycetota bacterium]
MTTHDSGSGSDGSSDKRLTHIDSRGQARMVDISHKDTTVRTAVASSVVTTTADVIDAIRTGRVPKGDVAAVVRIAGIMAAKQTHTLIPLCHPVPLDAVQIELEFPSDTTARIVATCTCEARTGVEMEALTAASIGALALYDMCKALDRGIVIGPVQLELKTGGKTGAWMGNSNHAVTPD